MNPCTGALLVGRAAREAQMIRNLRAVTLGYPASMVLVVHVRQASKERRTFTRDGYDVRPGDGDRRIECCIRYDDSTSVLLNLSSVPRRRESKNETEKIIYTARFL
jgi:hypothetical protein